MLLYLFGTAAIIVATVFISKTARENGRSGVSWALIALAVGFGSQIVLPIIGEIAIAIIFMLLGTSQRDLANKIEGPATILFYGLWLLSFVFLFLLLRFVANATVTPVEAAEVPPPPKFS